MTPKEIAAQYEAKVFDAPEAAKVAGFVLTETMEPRNVWNKASAALALFQTLRGSMVSVKTNPATLAESGESKTLAS